MNCSGENWKQTGTSKGTKKYEKSSDDWKEASRKHSGAFGRIRKQAKRIQKHSEEFGKIQERPSGSALPDSPLRQLLFHSQDEPVSPPARGMIPAIRAHWGLTPVS